MYKKQIKRPKNTNLSQFGLIDFSDPDENHDNISLGSDDDFDLEAELAAISAGSASKRKPAKPKAAPAANLDAMIAESLKDIPSDEDVSGDDDDPDLLNELDELTIDDSEARAPPPRTSRPAPPPPSAEGNMTIKLLQERILMYQAAEKNATAKGESSRARRFNRGLKTLNDMMKQAKAGRPIKEEEIPPVVATGNAPTPQLSSEGQPSLPEPVELPPLPPQDDVPPIPPPRQKPPTPIEDVAPSPVSEPKESDSGLQLILKRKEEFKAAALTNKQTDKQLALELLKVAKQMDTVIDAYKSGQEMDLNELPTVEMMIETFRNQEKEEPPAQATNEPQPSPSSAASGLITASSLEEGLKQHLAYYKEQEQKASGNPSKQRRMGRIVKQFSSALAQATAGRTPDLNELPTPLGYAPLTQFVAAKSPPPAAASRSAPAVPRVVSRADKQLAFLLRRQKEFREAAITAKKNGDIAQAKEYLRSAKGFDSIIDAAKGGLKVDLNSLPLPPRAKEQLEDTFDVVSADDCDPLGDDVLTTLHQQLSSQLKLCLTNRDHYRAMGNVAETNRFEHLGVTVKQDLDVITIAKRLNKEPPKFHYESRQFSIVQCNTDLNENDLELTIVRGIAYNVPNPKEVDTYVKFEFPYCSTSEEESTFDKTELVKDTNSPVYNAVFPIIISRSSRRCQRVFKRYGVKLEVYAKGGWFSKDPLLGTVVVKLAPLETSTTIHEAYPLMDGRRPAGGSLEVKLRVRTPLVQQQLQNTAHRWLVVDN